MLLFVLGLCVMWVMIGVETGPVTCVQVVCCSVYDILTRMWKCQALVCVKLEKKKKANKN